MVDVDHRLNVQSMFQIVLRSLYSYCHQHILLHTLDFAEAIIICLLHKP